MNMNMSFFEDNPLLDDLHLKINILSKFKNITINDLLNIIFYGLPATGKTTKIYAFLATILDKKVYDLKDGQAILYTRNEYQQSSRKIVKGKIVHIINKKICVGNGTYVWDLRINDDVIVYI